MKIRSAILSGLLALFFCFPIGKGASLKEVTKPYLGVYECTQATYGELDCLTQFSYISIELKEDDSFLLRYKEKNGERKEEEGKYLYDREKETITLLGEKGFFKREFPLKEGILTITLRIGESTLLLKFEQK